MRTVVMHVTNSSTFAKKTRHWSRLAFAVVYWEKGNVVYWTTVYIPNCPGSLDVACGNHFLLSVSDFQAVNIGVVFADWVYGLDELKKHVSSPIPI